LVEQPASHTRRERLAGGSVRTAADAVARALRESV
jgi:hypothetical protein